MAENNIEREKKLREGLAKLFKECVETVNNNMAEIKSKTGKSPNRNPRGLAKDQMDVTGPDGLKGNDSMGSKKTVSVRKGNRKSTKKKLKHDTKNHNAGSPKSLDESLATLLIGNNKGATVKQTQISGVEDKKAMVNKNVQDDEEASISVKQAKYVKSKKKTKKKVRQQHDKVNGKEQQQRKTISGKCGAQKRKSPKGNEFPTPKKSKFNCNFATKQREKKNQIVPRDQDSDENLQSDSTLESNYDADLDDTFEFSSKEEDDFDYSNDEDDYDEENSSYDNGNDGFNDFSDISYCDFEEFQDLDNDPDYELPEGEVENLVVHKGLAVKYELESHHGVEFDDNNEDIRIVELPNQTIKPVKQHEGYDVEQLRSLEQIFVEKKSNSALVPTGNGDNCAQLVQTEKNDCPHLVSIAKNDCPHLVPTDKNDCPQLVPTDKNDCPQLIPIYEKDCPQLVPVDDENDYDDGFNLWTSGISMDNDMFSDFELVEDSDRSEESSVTSLGDLGRKYMCRMGYSDSNESEGEDDSMENSIKSSMQGVIIKDSTKSPFEAGKLSDLSTSETEEKDFCLSEIIRKATKQSSKFPKVKIIKGELKKFVESRIEGGDEKKSWLRNKASLCNIFASLQDNEVENSMKIAETDEDLISAVDIRDDKSIEHNDSFETFIDQHIKDFYTSRKSMLRSMFCNSMDSYYVLVLMKSPIFIYGTVNVKLMAGSAEIYGYKLKMSEMVTVHSPRGYCAIPFMPKPSLVGENENSEEKILAEVQSLSDLAEFNSREVKELLSGFNAETDALLMLTRNETAVKMKTIFQENINENIYPVHIPHSRPLFSSEIMLDCMLNATNENALEIPPQWHDIQIKENSKLMIVGGKSVGKSTMLRYLLNKNLNKYPSILLIDLDIGQPEIFVPQTVSCALLDMPLLGPGFFYQHQPTKAYAVGHTNLSLCGHAYMRAVIKLIDFCYTQSSYSDIPWLINTMGYNKGFGEELISVICSHLKPTDIVQLQSNKPINNFDVLFQSSVITNIPRNIYNKAEYESSASYQPSHQLHILPSAILQQSRFQQEWQMSAKDLRYIMQLARLSAVLPEDGEWLNHSETYVHNLEKLRIINSVTPNADARETLKSLESNLVYLCHVKQTAFSMSNSFKNYGEEIEEISPPECLGIGIVRAIDYQAKQIFILPAIPLEKLTYINCLALGEMSLPGSLLIEQNPETKFNVPFVQVMSNEATSRAVKQFFYRS